MQWTARTTKEHRVLGKGLQQDAMVSSVVWNEIDAILVDGWCRLTRQVREYFAAHPDLFDNIFCYVSHNGAHIHLHPGTEDNDYWREYCDVGVHLQMVIDAGDRLWAVCADSTQTRSYDQELNLMAHQTVKHIADAARRSPARDELDALRLWRSYEIYVYIEDDFSSRWKLLST